MPLLSTTGKYTIDPIAGPVKSPYPSDYSIQKQAQPMAGGQFDQGMKLLPIFPPPATPPTREGELLIPSPFDGGGPGWG
ncbi:MAG: hypothetical protein C4530_00320 [Desulfobacteraceae bacterium]|nr:MAG: hypothetical protein C4530_00320 [Desulfobacteraceae bacterium]